MTALKPGFLAIALVIGLAGPVRAQFVGAGTKGGGHAAHPGSGGGGHAAQVGSGSGGAAAQPGFGGGGAAAQAGFGGGGAAAQVGFGGGGFDAQPGFGVSGYAGQPGYGVGNGGYYSTSGGYGNYGLPGAYPNYRGFGLPGYGPGANLNNVNFAPIRPNLAPQTGNNMGGLMNSIRTQTGGGNSYGNGANYGVSRRRGR